MLRVNNFSKKDLDAKFREDVSMSSGPNGFVAERGKIKQKFSDNVKKLELELNKVLNHPESTPEECEAAFNQFNLNCAKVMDDILALMKNLPYHFVTTEDIAFGSNAAFTDKKAAIPEGKFFIGAGQPMIAHAMREWEAKLNESLSKHNMNIAFGMNTLLSLCPKEDLLSIAQQKPTRFARQYQTSLNTFKSALQKELQILLPLSQIASQYQERLGIIKIIQNKIARNPEVDASFLRLEIESKVISNNLRDLDLYIKKENKPDPRTLKIKEQLEGRLSSLQKLQNEAALLKEAKRRQKVTISSQELSAEIEIMTIHLKHIEDIKAEQTNHLKPQRKEEMGILYVLAGEVKKQENDSKSVLTLQFNNVLIAAYRARTSLDICMKKQSVLSSLWNNPIDNLLNDFLNDLYRTLKLCSPLNDDNTIEFLNNHYPVVKEKDIELYPAIRTYYEWKGAPFDRILNDALEKTLPRVLITMVSSYVNFNDFALFRPKTAPKALPSDHKIEVMADPKPAPRMRVCNRVS
jgi:hypothetical protein